MKKLFNLLAAEWRAAFDPKSIVLNDCNDVKVHAKSLQHLSEEERETLLEFVTQAEIARQTGRDTTAVYGITVGEALAHQHMMQDIESIVSSSI